MTLVIKAHAGRTGVLLAAALSLVVLATAGHAVVLPQLLQGLVRPVNVGLIVSLGFAPLTAYVFGGPALFLESLSRRRLRSADAMLVSLVIAPVVVCAAVSALLGDGGPALNAIRDAVAFVALTLLLLTVVKPSTAAGVPVAYFLAMATIGLRADGSVPWWAWLRADDSWRATVAALVLLAVAATTFHRWARARAVARRSVDEEVS